MEIAGVLERAETIAAVRADADADPSAIERALQASSQIKAWLASGDAELTRRLSSKVSFPEKNVADCTRTSIREAAKTKERSETLAATPSLAGALDRADITAAHIDAITRTAKSLDDDEQRAELFERADGLRDVAAAATVEQFNRRLALEAKNIQRSDGMDRLERQRRATRLRTWTDAEGMWCISGRFDPVTGVQLANRLEHTVETRFAEATPDTCPTDPIEKQHHLRALALVSLVQGSTGGTRPGRPEYVVVIDTTQPDGAGGLTVDWGLPVEIPHRILGEMMNGGDVHPVVVRNGAVLHAPGTLDLGRSTRLANRAQRRALRALYATCAIPGCHVHYDRCKLHHITWWRHGGHTDLANLLPVCAHHHTKIHDHGWQVTLGPNRELTIRFPDGTVRCTGPPTRAAA